jgi:hypothetical protein
MYVHLIENLGKMVKYDCRAHLKKGHVGKLAEVTAYAFPDTILAINVTTEEADQIAKKWADQDTEVALVRGNQSYESSVMHQRHFMEMLRVRERQREEFIGLLEQHQGHKVVAGEELRNGDIVTIENGIAKLSVPGGASGDEYTHLYGAIVMKEVATVTVNLMESAMQWAANVLKPKGTNNG